MDSVSIAGAAMLMNAAQTRQTLSMSMIKMNSDVQSRVVNMLTQVMETPPPDSSSGYDLSVYA